MMLYNKFMFCTYLGILIRILSNSYLNVFQKILSNFGQKSSVINFYTYLGLSCAGICFLNSFSMDIFSLVLLMGFLGTLGNYFIIKALSVGELSALAPINSYKPVAAMFIGMIFLKEMPSLIAICGIFLIIAGTYFIFAPKGSSNKIAILYRVLALLFSAAEAVVIKKIIIFAGVNQSFILWAVSGLLFSSIMLIFAKTIPVLKSYKYQMLLILSVGVMQYSTNYVFSKINVAYALALFQLSTILSVFLGANMFHEKNIKRKLAGSAIMVIGAIIIILS